MNLGIVIGVSNYPNGVGNLLACKTDADAIAALLTTESKFDHVLVVSDNTTSSSVKRQLTEFITQHKDQSIDEVLFYFTGHGDFTNDEFYYLLSDYDPKRRKQTSLENSEIDSLLKALSPNIAVKLIDACHSGVTYIKDPNAFDTYLKGTMQTFKKCYFMFSSQVEQSSYQDTGLSFFTRAVVDSVLTHSEIELRYKDVIDYVSDEFTSDTKQTPFFVVQADFTEMFCTVSSVLKTALNKAVAGTVPPAVMPAHKTMSIADRIREDANRYCTEEEAQEELDELRKQFQSITHPNELEGLFSISVRDGTEISEIPSKKPIGQWLAQTNHELFAKESLRWVTVEKRRLKTSSFAAIASLRPLGDDAYETYSVEEQQVNGFTSTVDMRYRYLHLQAEPMLPNITANDCYIVPLVSKTDIRLFYTFTAYRDVGWEKRKPDNNSKWITESFPIKDNESREETVKKIIDSLWEFIHDQIKEKFGPSDPTNSEASGADSDEEVE